jgi:hypothetical protein
VIEGDTWPGSDTWGVTRGWPLLYLRAGCYHVMLVVLSSCRVDERVER